MKLQEGSRVLDIERAVNGGMATGVLLCVRETDPKQVDVRYDDGTCRRLLPKSRFKLLVEPPVLEGSRVLDIQRAVNAGVAKGVITSVRDDHGQQRVDVRYDDGTVRQALPKSQFKVLEEPQSRNSYEIPRWTSEYYVATMATVRRPFNEDSNLSNIDFEPWGGRQDMRT